ncbi:hypothetical protein [Streptosporangium sp. NPDC051022]|uniref:hypothetical protein n=1 Tax=Streptosporangium sp. NPDC051022 TaxID=3155752 RepID=UPI003426389E
MKAERHRNLPRGINVLEWGGGELEPTTRSTVVPPTPEYVDTLIGTAFNGLRPCQHVTGDGWSVPADGQGRLPIFELKKGVAWERREAVLMADVRSRKSPVDVAWKRKHPTLSVQRDHGQAGATRTPRRKEAEEQAALALFDQAQRLYGVAASTHETETRDTVREVVQDLLAHAEPVRATIASKILGVDEKTVRAWVKEGLLTSVKGKPRLMLDADRLYEVATVVRDLRRAGRTRNLAELLWHHLQDQELLEDDRLADGLRQMKQGEGRPWREIKAEWGSKNSETAAGEA